MVRAFIAAVAAVVAVTLVAGCGPQSAEHAQPTHSSTASPTKAAPPYLAEPKAGECHDLSLKDVAATSDTKKPVPCSSRHTTQTVAVVTAPPDARKGSANARAFAVGTACADGFKKVVGGDSKSRAKTLYSLAWFMPTKAQRTKGATWMRCDVTLSDEEHAYVLTGKVPFLSHGIKKSELRCGRLKPGNKAWEFVPCTTKHQFVADKFIQADPAITWKQAAKVAEKACSAELGLFSWSLPEQWGIGDRWYVCWSPVAGHKNNNVVT